MLKLLHGFKKYLPSKKGKKSPQKPGLKHNVLIITVPKYPLPVE